MLKYESIHRISENTLLKFIEITGDLEDFNVVQSEMEMDNKQYFKDEDINFVVWDSGEHEHSLNKVYSSTPLFPLENVVAPKISGRYIQLNIMLKQEFNWDNKFGFHILIKSTKTGDILLSKIVTIDDFKFTNNKELIDGSFWMEEAVSYMPNFDEILSAQVTELNYDDVDVDDMSSSLGYIYNYPTELFPLIEEKPVADYIRTEITLDDSHYLNVTLSTNENKTLEQSILDYFEVEVANIEVKHQITYGNGDTQWKSMRIENTDNKYGDLNIGLNLLPWIDTTDINSVVEVFVNTEIYVDKKLMSRQAQISTDLQNINPILQSNITHPTTNYPVEVTIEENIEQTVIETKRDTKIVQILQPVYIDIIKQDLTVSARLVSFDSLSNDAYLKIIEPEQLIASKRTSDDVIYFDLSELQPVEEPTTYELYDRNTNNIIGTGTVTK